MTHTAAYTANMGQLTIAQGYRFGNFKPSPPTVEALLEVMKAQHVPIKEYKRSTVASASN